jgi:hypothetical protein
MKRNAVLIRHKLVISHPRDQLLKRLPADFVFGIVRCYIKNPRIIKKARQLYHMFDGLTQCSEYMTFWHGSGMGCGSSDPYLRLTDPYAATALDTTLFVSDLQDAPPKIFFSKFLRFLLFECTFSSFFKDKKV